MTSRPVASKRSTAPPAFPAEPVAKPPCHIHSLAVVAEKAQISGTHPVQIGAHSVLHPYAKLRAEHGKVVIGARCTISEKASIGTLNSGEDAEVVIGDGVNIETGAIVEASSVGDGTIIEVNAKIGRGAVIGKHCKITPLNEIQPGERLPDFTVVYGDNQRRFDQTLSSNAEVLESKERGQEMHVELLAKLIPNASAKWNQ